MKPDRNPLAPYQIHLAPVLGLCVSERVERGIRNHPEPGRIRISNYFCLGTYAVLADPQMPVTSTLLDQAHNTIERELFAMKGFHHPDGSQQAFLRGLAHLYNL